MVGKGSSDFMRQLAEAARNRDASVVAYDEALLAAELDHLRIKDDHEGQPRRRVRSKLKNPLVAEAPPTA